MPLSEELERAKGYGDIFALVKKTVKRSLGEHRVGLMLYLGNLPMRVGAFHPMGTNDIVLNRRLINATAKTEPAWKAYVFTILLHEYLHALGYLDEGQVRELVVKVTTEVLGGDHLATQISIRGYRPQFEEAQPVGQNSSEDPELIRDFDRSNQGYIA